MRVAARGAASVSGCVFLLLLLVCGVMASPRVGGLTTELVKWDKPEADRHYFDPWRSSSFRLVQQALVNVSFLDHTMFRGYDAEDVVQLGEYNIITRACFITQSTGHSLSGVDGIIGFGYLNFTRSPAFVETLTRRHRPSWDVTQPGEILSPRKFAFVAADHAGELQLGGYDPASIAGPMRYTDNYPNTGSYSIGVTSITYGGRELLTFTPGNTSLPALLDTGTSCMTLPSGNMFGKLQDAPYDLYNQAVAELGNQPLILTIGGHEYVLPYEHLHGEKGCVYDSPHDLILGDPFFRQFVVEFDLSLDPHRFGLALQNPQYSLVKDKLPESTKYPLQRQWKTDRAGENGQSVSHVPIVDRGNVQYLIRLGIGTPPQESKVIFDTGSYMLGIFSRDPSDRMAMAASSARPGHPSLDAADSGYDEDDEEGEHQRELLGEALHRHLALEERGDSGNGDDDDSGDDQWLAQTTGEGATVDAQPDFLHRLSETVLAVAALAAVATLVAMVALRHRRSHVSLHHTRETSASLQVESKPLLPAACVYGAA